MLDVMSSEEFTIEDLKKIDDSFNGQRCGFAMITNVLEPDWQLTITLSDLRAEQAICDGFEEAVRLGKSATLWAKCAITNEWEVWKEV